MKSRIKECECLVVFGKLVTDAPDCQDVTGFFLVRFDERSQAADMHVDGAGFYEGFVSPDILQQLLPGINPSRMTDQEGQQFDFPRRELDFFAVDRYLVGVQVDPDATEG